MTDEPSLDGHVADNVRSAALWLAAETDIPHPLVPRMCERFGLSVKEACDAIRRASDLRHQDKSRPSVLSN